MSRLSVPESPWQQRVQALSLLPWLLIFAVFSVGAASPDLADTVPRVLPTVVHIAIRNSRSSPDPSVGDSVRSETLVAPAHRGTAVAGSGVIIGKDGYILTVAYLFDASDRVLVRLNDGREFPARLVGRDQRSGIALLKIYAPGLAAARIGDPQKLRLAERVFAVGGLPSGLSATVTDGIVSAIGTQQRDLVGFIATTVPLYPAMGGGPLFSQNGEVVGTNSTVYTRSTGTGA